MPILQRDYWWRFAPLAAVLFFEAGVFIISTFIAANPGGDGFLQFYRSSMYPVAILWIVMPYVLELLDRRTERRRGSAAVRPYM